MRRRARRTLSGRRPSRTLSVLLAGALLLASTPGLAEPNVDEAKRHFLNGVHLFEDRNFAGALAEFEASYRMNPTAVALQNIAVAQKGLFRYVDAIETLDELLRDFGGTLSPSDRKAAEDAIREMNALLGTIVVKTTPAGATVSIDGAALTSEAARRPIRLAAGEYRVSAEAPGYARAEQVITVASGDKEKPVELSLAAITGTLVVRAADPLAAIAIDQVPVAWGTWSGSLPIGVHLVHVYKPGVRPFATMVTIVAGQTAELAAPLAPPEEGPYKGPYAPPPAYTPPDSTQRGFYVAGSLGAYAVSAGKAGSADVAASSMQIDRAEAGAELGIRGGFRFAKHWAVELMVDADRHDLKVCRGDAWNAAHACPEGSLFDAHLATTRFGPSLRYFANGATGRFVASLGVGAASHKLVADRAPSGGATPADESGTETYLLIDAGYAWSFGRWFVEPDVVFVGESSQKLEWQGLGKFGVGVRVGWAEW